MSAQEMTYFEIQNEKGETISCQVLFTFTGENNGKEYIVYTDGTVNDKGETNVYASVKDPQDPQALILVETPEEWEMIGQKLAEYAAQEE